MKVIILAAGQGTRLRPLTNEIPKCMVEINGMSIIYRQIETLKKCGIIEKDIYILTGYKGIKIKEYFKNTEINFIDNTKYETTNMVYTLMCAKQVLERNDDLIISYGDIIYSTEVFIKLLNSTNEISVIVDNDWLNYWKKRCANPLDDAESLIMDEKHNLIEIGQKTVELSHVQSQYIGLMRFKGLGIKKIIELSTRIKNIDNNSKPLLRTNRNFNKLYMTDLLQGLIDEGNKLKAVEINRGWYEIDCYEDLKLVEAELN